ncbi:thiamine pyrophosphate-dependent dehydrogenase E1 component subunit alpha [Pseudonocardia sp. K10HN5]|uniref:Thiamine pyrophosphate-dependent dehydrogenase E1 component subunit alpha n=2 Tax=Pseudonocardia acidicola TaxID=2724939 RepID=A0ABX1S9I7_9PSEU|nr:thiamine pyrophosphate-dependent dehydrogenase E1 component subunit alpha [Pseudonocardia acidicola]
MYRLMVVTTLADERSVKEAKAGKLQAAFYPVRGMEAVCAAYGEALRADDRIVSTYRNLGDALAKGATLRSIMAELYGRVDGMSKGKGGPMHLHDASVGFMATTGIVGSGLPIAVGLGLAAQLDASSEGAESRVVGVTFGDGATSIGTTHEALNLAALWSLPVVFVCQNNQWGEHTPIAEYTASTELADRARAYGMKAVKVDGFDAIATWRALRDAVEHARSGAGPVFVEAVTYRLTGHSGTADYSYVPREELDAALARDPAPTFRRWLAEEGLVTNERLDELDAEAAEYVDDAFAYAEASPAPGPDELMADVFADNTWVRGLA